MNSPDRSATFVSFLAHVTLSGILTVSFYIWVRWHQKHTHIWKRTQFWNILPTIGTYPKIEDLTSPPPFPDQSGFTTFRFRDDKISWKICPMPCHIGYVIRAIWHPIDRIFQDIASYSGTWKLWKPTDRCKYRLADGSTLRAWHLQARQFWVIIQIRL